MSDADTEEIVGIKNLEAEFDVALAKELAQAYLDDTSSIVERLRHALTNRDQETLRSSAHMLKGCSRAIQAWQCEKASAVLENNARDGDMDSAAENLINVVDAYSQTEMFLRRYLE